MQVSGVEVPQQTSGEKATAQPQQPSGGIFAAFLKSAIGNAYSTIRLDPGAEIGQQIVAEASSNTSDDYPETSALEENTEPFVADDTDADAAPKAEATSPGSDAEANDTDDDAALANANAEDALGTSVPGQIAEIALATASTKQIVAARSPAATAQQAPQSPNAAARSLSATAQQAPQSPNAAAVTVAAQAEKLRGEGNRTGNLADKASDNSGNLLLNDGANKADRARNALRLATQAAANAPQPKAGEPGPAPNPQGAGFSALLAQNRPGAATATTHNGAANLVRGAESLPLNSGTGLANGTTSPSSVSRPTPPPVPTNVQPRALTGQIAVQIQKSVAQGLDRINIQLKPAELGRVEIRLDVMQDGRVAATIVADRPETLELLQRDTRGLQQALQDAGLKSDAANLSFNLGGGNASDEQQAAESNAGDNSGDGENLESLAEAETETPRRRAGNGMIDVEV